MAVNSFLIAGPATLYLARATEDMDQRQAVGISREGFQVELQIRLQPIATDVYAGDEQLPADIQYVGELALVRGQLIQIDSTVLHERVFGRFPDKQPGQTLTPGTLLFANNKYWKAWIEGAYEQWYFPRAVFGENITVPLGTRASYIDIAFVAYPVEGVVFQRNTSNTTTTTA